MGLQKLEITPFEFGLLPLWVFDNGSLFEPAVLDIEDSQILSVFQSCLRNTACVSLELGMPTVASVPYSILLASATCWLSPQRQSSPSRKQKKSKPTSKIQVPSHRQLVLLRQLALLLLPQEQQLLSRKSLRKRR